MLLSLLESLTRKLNIFELQRSYFLNICLLLFIVFTFMYRYWDVFFKRYGSRGRVYFGWTLYLLAISHTLIGIFSLCEFFFIRRQYNPIIGIISLACFTTGQIIRNLAIASLKEFHSAHIEIKPNHQLIQTGPYKRIRNPYYVGVMLEVLSTPLILNSFFTFLFSIFVYLPELFIRVFLEEKILTNQLGCCYASYLKKVPRFLPRF